MRKLILLALLGLSACVDRGQCLQSHVVHHPDEMTIIPMFIPNGSGGGTTTLMPIFVAAHDETVCDRWQYPEGKPHR